jgi:hypothetical protein
MLRIRNEQIPSLNEPAVEAFTIRMMAHLRTHFSAECERIGEDGLRVAIHHGLARARAYGITQAKSVRTYLNLMFTFGRDFDRDPALPWAAEDLAGPPASATGKLYVHALSHLDRAGGLDPLR